MWMAECGCAFIAGEGFSFHGFSALRDCTLPPLN